MVIDPVAMQAFVSRSQHPAQLPGPHGVPVFDTHAEPLQLVPVAHVVQAEPAPALPHWLLVSLVMQVLFEQQLEPVLPRHSRRFEQQSNPQPTRTRKGSAGR